MRKVNSTAIESVSYNPFWMTIKFHSGKKYRYYGVTYRQYRALRTAESVGRLYNQMIKGKFVSAEV